MTERAQVVVIGSGAGGGVCAARLAERGVDVLLMEEGEHHPASTMTQDELQMIPKLFQERGQRGTEDQAILLMQGRALGGGTAHNTGLCVPISEGQWQRWREEFGVEEQWATFSSRLDEVLSTIQARVADEDEINENNRLLRRGAESLGLSWFTAKHNRIKCSGCGYCTLGCAYNRKMGVVHAWLPRGVSHGLRIATGCRATRVRQAAGRRVVQYVDTAGRAGEIETEQVVFAAGAVHTPILMQASGMGRGRRVGRDLRLHPFAPIGAVFDDDIVPWRGVPQTIIIDDRARFLRGGDDGFLLMVAAAQPGVAAALTPGVGADHRRTMTRYRKLAAAGVLVHDEARGRVRARRDGKPLIRYWPSARDRDSFREGIKLLAELYFAVGAREIVLPFIDLPSIQGPDEIDRIDGVRFKKHTVTIASVHAQGSCPIGRERDGAAVDGRGAIRGADGCWVADASLFPESLGLPPQVTIMAMGLMVADSVGAALAS